MPKKRKQSKKDKKVPDSLIKLDKELKKALQDLKHINMHINFPENLENEK